MVDASTHPVFFFFIISSFFFFTIFHLDFSHSFFISLSAPQTIRHCPFRSNSVTIIQRNTLKSLFLFFLIPRHPG